MRGADERETVVSNERLELAGPRGQPPRDVAPDEGRFHEEGRNHDVPYGSPSVSVPPRFLESEEASVVQDKTTVENAKLPEYTNHVELVEALSHYITAKHLYCHYNVVEKHCDHHHCCDHILTVKEGKQYRRVSDDNCDDDVPPFKKMAFKMGLRSQDKAAPGFTGTN